MKITDKQGTALTTEQIVKKGAHRVTTIMREFIIFLLHLAGNIPSHTIRSTFYRLAGMTIGAKSAVHMGLVLYNPAHISIGSGTIIGERCVLDGRDTLTIGDHVDIASEVMIYNSQHDVHDPYFTAIEKPVVIENYVFIGPRAVILPGVTIKNGAVVAAGAVVSKDVDASAIVAGIPAQQIGKRKIHTFQYKLGRAALFR